MNMHMLDMFMVPTRIPGMYEEHVGKLSTLLM